MFKRKWAFLKEGFKRSPRFVEAFLLVSGLIFSSSGNAVENEIQYSSKWLLERILNLYRNYEILLDYQIVGESLNIKLKEEPCVARNQKGEVISCGYFYELVESPSSILGYLSIGAQRYNGFHYRIHKDRTPAAVLSFYIDTRQVCINKDQIPEADKARIDWSKFKAWPFSSPLRPSWWTVDHERNVFLVWLEGRGPDSERPETYALYWKGDVIRFEAERAGKGDFQTGVDMLWKIFNISIPDHLEGQRQEILNTLKEAIDAHGSVYRREQVKSVHVEII